MRALELATKFHDTYQRLAPQFGYETRPETKVFNDSSPNGRLMVAVAHDLLASDDLLSGQINRLAEYIMENFPKSIQGGGAVDTAIELLARLKGLED